MHGPIPWLIAFLIALAGCGEEGYSFGEHGEWVAEIGPSVDAFCVRAAECVPRAFGGDEHCRFVLLVGVFNAGASCEGAALEFFACGAQAPCLEFPTVWHDAANSGRCDEETAALLSCGDEQVAEGASMS